MTYIVVGTIPFVVEDKVDKNKKQSICCMCLRFMY